MDMQSIGPYQVVRRLGRGGMGTVYEGVDPQSGQHVAIKVLAAPLAREEGFRERFDAEIDTLRKLRHPGIVQLLGFGEQDEHVFYAMELVDGPSLEELLQAGRRFEWREVAQIGADLCRALRHAHDRGIVHRDIKPGNLLRGPDGSVKISDFGIARLFGHNRITSVGSVLGTAEYMSPEQAEGRPVDARSDLYSLGAVFYSLLTGRPPFQATSVPEVLHLQRFGKHEPLGPLVPQVPPELETLIDQLLAKEVGQRPANASLVAKRLQSLLQPPELDATQASSAPLSTEFSLPTPSEAHGTLPPDSGCPPRAVTHNAEDLAMCLPPSMQNLPPAAEPLPPTKATAAFHRGPAEAASRSDEHPGGKQAPGKQPPSESRAPSEAAPEASPEHRPRGARFVPVDRDELDPPDTGGVHSPISLQTGLLALSLVAMAALFWYFLQPLSADALYERIAQHTSQHDVRSLADAEDEIREFLLRFPSDSRADWLKKQQEELELDRLERRFERRAAGLIRSERLGPVEQDYLEAIQYSRIDPDVGLTRLQALLDLYEQRAEPSAPLGRCLELARRRHKRLSEQISEQAEPHAALVQQRLDHALSRLPTEPDQALRMCRAIVELYRRKPWAADVVRKAEQVLREHPTATPPAHPGGSAQTNR